MSDRPSVRMEQLGPHWTDFHKIWYLSIFRKSLDKTQFSLESDKKTDTLHEYLWTFMMISCWILLGMRNVSGESCRVNKIILLCSIIFSPENRAFYEILWENRQATVGNTKHVVSIMDHQDNTRKHSEWLIIISVPLQQWLRERAPVLRCTCNASVVSAVVIS